MKSRLAWLILFAMIAGCTKLPFEAEPMPALANPDPRAMRESFARELPNRFISDDTMIIQAPFHDDLAVLDVLRVDRSAGTFELVALNHLWIKLFDLAGDRGNVSINYVLPPLMKLENILISIAHDISYMYLDQSPAEHARTEIESNKVQFAEKQSDGTVIYEFGGDPTVLREKQLNGWFGAKWRVRYFRYSTEFGGLYPRGIVMDNGRYHYRIIIKNRDVEIDR